METNKMRILVQTFISLNCPDKDNRDVTFVTPKDNETECVFTFLNKRDLKSCVNQLRGFKDKKEIIEIYVNEILNDLGIDGKSKFKAKMVCKYQKK